MNFRRPVKARAFFILFILLIIAATGAGNFIYAAVPPCPVVTDATIAQLAQQWAAMFKDPYCGFLQERSNILLRHKLSGGVFPYAGQMNGVFKTTDEATLSTAIKNIGKNTYKAGSKSIGIREIAAAKVRMLRMSASMAVYAAGRDSLVKSLKTERALQSFAPVSFDFVSKHQVQKDALKLAHLLGLVQAQELKMTSLLKMMHALEDER